MDWIDGNDQLEHNYHSAGLGGNRFATILLYMSDLGESKLLSRKSVCFKKVESCVPPC